MFFQQDSIVYFYVYSLLMRSQAYTLTNTFFRLAHRCLFVGLGAFCVVQPVHKPLISFLLPMTKRVRGASSSSSQSVLVTIFLAAACAIFMKAATCLAWRCYGAAAGRRASVSEVPLLSRRLPSSASLVRVRSLGHQTLMASDAADGGRASAAVKQDSNKRCVLRMAGGETKMRASY